MYFRNSQDGVFVVVQIKSLEWLLVSGVFYKFTDLYAYYSTG